GTRARGTRAPRAGGPPAPRRGRSRSPSPRLARHAEPALGDDVLLDLRGAAADDEAERVHEVGRPHAGVAHAGVALVERAVRAQDVERRPREVVVQLGRHQLVDRGRDAGGPLAERVGQLPGGVGLDGLDADGEVGEALTDDGVLARRPAVSPLRAREPHQLLEGLLRARGRAQHVALVGEGGVRHLPAGVQQTHQVRARHAHVLEEDLVEAGVARHLHERAHADAGRLHVDQEVGDAGVLGRVGVGAHQAEHPVGVLRVGGPYLLPVHDELVAAELRARAERRQVRARARLRVALAPDLRGGEDARQVTAPLLLAAVLDERRPDHRDAEEADQPRGPGAYHLLVDDRLAHDVGALAAVLARPGEGQVAGRVDLPLPGLGLGDAARIAEPEVAIHLGRDVPARAGGEAARAAIAALGAAIELVDIDRPLDDLEAILAANVFHRAVVLGPPRSERAGGALGGVTARAFHNGDQVAS